MKIFKKYNLNLSIQPDKIIFISSIFFFILCFVYINFFNQTILSFQEKQSLFLYTREYLMGFLLKPGGLLEYFGKFLTQFYFYPIVGSIILSSTISISIIICSNISKKIAGTSAGYFSIFFAALLLLMQSHYYHLMEYNLGFLLVLLFFYLSISSLSKRKKYVSLLLIPLFYYVAGAYLFPFLGIYILFNLFHEKEKYKFTFSIFALVISLLTFFIFYKLVFLQSIEKYFLYPLPILNVKNHKILLFLLLSFLMLLPAMLKLNLKRKSKRDSTTINFISIAGILALTIFLLIKFYNQQTVRVLKLEHYISEKKYDDAIRYHEKYPSQNLIGQYLYNIALSETDQLCERLFYGRQDFNVNALILPWSNEHLPWGARFFYSVGLINEAHRWAYEEMVVYGKRPQNIELLLKANIIKGSYARAKKYNEILHTTWNYNNLSKVYRKILLDTTLISQNPELMSKRKILTTNDFFIQISDPQNNIPLLLQSNPKNRKAFEYEMAWFLLSKDVETIVNSLKNLKESGFSRIPRHLEEAVLIYYNGTKKMPDLGGLTIRQETIVNFDKYVAAFKKTRTNSERSKQYLEKFFGNTFMYYFHFSK